MGVRRAIRTKFSLALLTSGILAMVILPGVANGMSPNTFCGDQAGLETISSGTFVNIIVPSPNDDDGQCKLTGTVHVTGNVKVNPGGELEVTAGVDIDGNLQAKGAAEIYVGTVVGPIIDGNIQIGGSTENVTIMGSTIGGDIKIKDQSAGIITIEENTVGGSIKLRANTAEEIHIQLNIVDEDIKLEDNEGTSDSESDTIEVDENVVSGNFEILDNITTGAGGRDIQMELNVVAGNFVVIGNESVNDDIEVRTNDVGGDLTVSDNTADEDNSTGTADIFVDKNCMTGNGDILVENNVSGEEIGVNFNGSDDVPGDCAGNEHPTNVTVTGNTAVLEQNRVLSNIVDNDLLVTGNTAGTANEVEDNVVDNDLLCSSNDPDPTTSGNTVGGTFDCSD